jgi:hypothetical protein
MIRRRAVTQLDGQIEYNELSFDINRYPGNVESCGRC